MAGDWTRVRADMTYCLVTGAGVEGRNTMWDALKLADPNMITVLQEGFNHCQSTAGSRANFDACSSEDARKLYNLGREICGMEPIP